MTKLQAATFSLMFLGLAAAGFAQCPHAGNNVGSIPYPPGGPYQGVSFRVWAPHATSVEVKDSASRTDHRSHRARLNRILV